VIVQYRTGEQSSTGTGEQYRYRTGEQNTYGKAERYRTVKLHNSWKVQLQVQQNRWIVHVYRSSKQFRYRADEQYKFRTSGQYRYRTCEKYRSRTGDQCRYRTGEQEKRQEQKRWKPRYWTGEQLLVLNRWRAPGASQVNTGYKIGNKARWFW
jgi:hypothetical protein